MRLSLFLLAPISFTLLIWQHQKNSSQELKNLHVTAERKGQECNAMHTPPYLFAYSPPATP